jgi:hypothetical protein
MTPENLDKCIKINKKILIRSVIDSHKKSQKCISDVDNLVGLDTEGPLADLIDRTSELNILLLGQILGDGHDNLFWYIFDNDCGKKEMQAGPLGDTKPIKNIDDLLWLIKVTEDDNN